MARTRTARHPKPEEFPAEEESQEAAEPANDNQPTSKADMVRAAIADGMEKPQEGVDWIKAHYGVELAKPMWSSYVAQQKARERKASGDESPRRTTPAPTGIPAGFGSDVREIRALIEKVGGADELKDLIGQLSGLIGKYTASGLGEIIEALG